MGRRGGAGDMAKRRWGTEGLLVVCFGIFVHSSCAWRVVCECVHVYGICMQLHIRIWYASDYVARASAFERPHLRHHLNPRKHHMQQSRNHS